MRALSFHQDESEYFDQLPESTQDLVQEMVSKACTDHCDGYGDDTAKPLDCRSRDGFSPFSHNKGGLVINKFTDLGYFWGGGNTVSHEGAQKEIQRQIDASFEYQADDLFEKYSDLLTSKGITKDQCNYHDLLELSKKDSDLDEIAQDCENTEMEYLSGDDSSIMYQVRFMYHGLINGCHTASVSCAVNTEGPYHRSSISWAPGIFCEGAKEIEIKWKTDSGLKKTLDKTLKILTAKIF